MFINKSPNKQKSKRQRISSYPVPEVENLLFYIQRRHTTDTVVYKLNYTASGEINYDYPMQVFWIKYNQNQVIKDINYLQSKLAYGYRSKVINQDLIEFRFVAHDKQCFIRLDQDSPQVVTKINGEMSVLTRVFARSDDSGVFTQVREVVCQGYRLSDGKEAKEIICRDTDCPK